MGRLRRHFRAILVAGLAIGCLTPPGAGSALALFTSTTPAGGNAFTTGQWACALAGSAVLSTANGSTVQDTYVDQKVPAGNYGTSASLYVAGSPGGSNKTRRMLLQFSPLPPIPAGCSFKTATLTLYQSTAVSGLTYSVYNLGSAWVDTTVTWANQPGTSGSPVTVTSNGGGPTAWNVNNLIAAQYAGVNRGFIVEDLAALQESNTYSSNESATPPTLTITWS